ncbi:DUF2860 family protein [Agarivorans sp. 1_MG-2023]|uniref:DUF2860 family protein n=1 Tax=Agarivorans sp. 1_MG-2023 TaxID=3062634 RepID=UPI0026E3E1AE|nr:DUF2860 family protein [Agarivorans sp. 1_MG-2023]MDO6762679.1 DUF2860 family protein [Agarivorans sp. 1_MG-2023]
MKKSQQAVSIAAAITTLLGAVSHANATGYIDDESGFGFELLLGATVGQQQSQFDTDDDNATTADLNNSGNKSSGVGPAVLGELNYTFANRKTQIFLGQQDENIVRGQDQIELGITQMVGEYSELELAYFPRIPGFSETWQDPYLTGSARQKTDADSSGFRMAWRYIFDTPVTLRYGFAKADIENERSGVAFGLDAAEQQLMQRDGSYHRLAAEVMVYDEGGLMITPQLTYTKADTDGDAMAFDGYGVGLEATYSFAERHFTSLFMNYAKRDYKGRNPIFSQTQDDDDVGINAIYGYMRPFDFDNSSLYVMASYEKGSSNISFYESKSLGMLVGVAYEF